MGHFQAQKENNIKVSENLLIIFFQMLRADRHIFRDSKLTLFTPQSTFCYSQTTTSQTFFGNKIYNADIYFFIDFLCVSFSDRAGGPLLLCTCFLSTCFQYLDDSFSFCSELFHRNISMSMPIPNFLFLAFPRATILRIKIYTLLVNHFSERNRWGKFNIGFQ